MLFKRNKYLPVVTAGADVLKQVAKPVEKITPELRAFVQEMLQTMRLFDGIGLAAPQVGSSLRLVVIEIPPEELKNRGKNATDGEKLLLPQMPIALINPKITEHSQTLAEREEGCLSVPSIFAPVVRPAEITVEFTSLDGKPIKAHCGGLLARCIQHELDHLDGLLFTDRLSPVAAGTIAADLNALIASGTKCGFTRVRK